MSTRRPYTYILLRYRHDPVAGELVNIGLLLHEPTAGYLGFRIRTSAGRLKKIFPDLDAEAFKATCRSLQRYAERQLRPDASSLLGRLDDAGTLARKVLPDDDGSYLWGTLGSGVTSNPAATLDTLYRRFVARYDDGSRNQRDDAAVWRPVRDRLAEKNLDQRLMVKIIASPIDSVEFEHAWKNGSWHCYQPLSFDLANGDNIREKARRWAGQMLTLRDATEPFRPNFFLGAPTDPALLPDYQAAIRILKLSPHDPAIFEECDLDIFVQQIEDDLRTHDMAGVSVEEPQREERIAQMVAVVDRR